MHVCTAHVCTYTHLTSFKTNYVRLLFLRQKTFKWEVSEVDSFAVQIFVWKDAQTMPFTIDLQCLLPRLLAVQKSRRMRLNQHNAHNMTYIYTYSPPPPQTITRGKAVLDLGEGDQPSPQTGEISRQLLRGSTSLDIPGYWDDPFRRGQGDWGDPGCYRTGEEVLLLSPVCCFLTLFPDCMSA